MDAGTLWKGSLFLLAFFLYFLYDSYHEEERALKVQRQAMGKRRMNRTTFVANQPPIKEALSEDSTSRVYFPEEIVDEFKPMTSEKKLDMKTPLVLVETHGNRNMNVYTNGSYATDQEISFQVDACVARGLTRGAVVVRRNVPEAVQCEPSSWGIITHLYSYPPPGEYKAVCVSWILDGKASTHNAHELFCVRPGFHNQFGNLKQDLDLQRSRQVPKTNG